MKSASAVFSSEDRAAIATTIANAERMTAAEIVPVVATASGRYDRAEDLFGVLVAILSLSIAWILFNDPQAASWSFVQPTSLSLPVVAAIVLIGFILGATLATHFPILRLPFISRGEMLEEVERSAIETFQRQRIRNTKGATGVLIYVSLYEHLIKVIGDDAVNEKLGSDALEEICSLVVAGLKQNQPTHGLQQAIARAGELLSAELPSAQQDLNELNNELILID